MSEFFKKYQNLTSPQGDYLLMTYMKKFSSRSLTGSKGSRLFGNSLENLGKGTGECKTKHSDTFAKFLKFFANIRKN